MDEARTALWAEIGRSSRGELGAWWKLLLVHDPDALRRVHELISAAEDGPVPVRLKHLLWMAVDSVVTHIYPRGLGGHAAAALAHGASPSQILEALEIASAVSLNRHFAMVGAIEDLSPTEPVDGKRSAGAGGATAFSNALASMAPARDEGRGLDRGWRELMFVACYGCPAIGDQEGVRRHSIQALELGVSFQEVCQVLRLAACIGVHPLASGVMEAAPHFADEGSRISKVHPGGALRTGRRHGSNPSQV